MPARRWPLVRRLTSSGDHPDTPSRYSSSASSGACRNHVARELSSFVTQSASGNVPISRPIYSTAMRASTHGIVCRKYRIHRIIRGHTRVSAVKVNDVDAGPSVRSFHAQECSPIMCHSRGIRLRWSAIYPLLSPSKFFGQTHVTVLSVEPGSSPFTNSANDLRSCCSHGSVLSVIATGCSTAPHLYTRSLANSSGNPNPISVPITSCTRQTTESLMTVVMSCLTRIRDGLLNY